MARVALRQNLEKAEMLKTRGKLIRKCLLFLHLQIFI